MGRLDVVGETDYLDVFGKCATAMVRLEALQCELSDIVHRVGHDEIELLTRVAEVLHDADSLRHVLVEENDRLPGKYSRHVLIDDPSGRYTALLIVWAPGARSPVHSHRAWCVYRVMEGELTERSFAKSDIADGVSFIGQRPKVRGFLGMSTSTSAAIHQLRNESGGLAVSLHIYGVDASRVATEVNRVFDELGVTG